ncbi:hypothetical protein WM40_19425 [Robbsia andropogonis]|uniref:Uncharacterized protein n=1 Tax=Robbsia andropogonis TaxID=28092 RepID=A0A0F5JW58_9BURK|nr:hypothetical protein [Robbsia andropogonis]KKB62073.1 hypothetical protein WM40_19425 [Robbsia andropogonis]MCP1117407.1 hypothetical protein [Robbsia andropogonis]MCP1126873.1 hypothetical protein [Robbsia andropogonis]
MTTTLPPFLGMSPDSTVRGDAMQVTETGNTSFSGRAAAAAQTLSDTITPADLQHFAAALTAAYSYLKDDDAPDASPTLQYESDMF